MWVWSAQHTSLGAAGCRSAYLLLHLDADGDVLLPWHHASLGSTDALHGLARGAAAEQQEQNGAWPATASPGSGAHGGTDD